MDILPNQTTPPTPPSTDADWMAITLSQIMSGLRVAGGVQLNRYNQLRKIVYSNPKFTSDQIYAAVEAANTGDANKLGFAARLAKTSLLAVGDPDDDRIKILAADNVPVFKLLDPLNPPSNLSDSAKAAFAEIAASL